MDRYVRTKFVDGEILGERRGNEKDKVERKDEGEKCSEPEYPPKTVHLFSHRF
jgi:hypothetical protein